MPVDPDLLPEIMAAAQKRFGGIASIKMGDEVLPVRRISTGSIELDLATWGGFPMGRMIRPWGAKSSFKSLLTWHMIIEAQREGLICAYYDSEGTYDEQFVTAIGVDTSKLILVQEFTGIIEDLVVQIQSLLSAAHVHVVDSVGHGISRERIETAPGQKMSRASKARAWSEYIPDLESRMDKRENMIVFIDQIRTHQTHGHEINSSSNIFDHASSMDLHTRRVASLYRDANGEFVSKKPQKGPGEAETLGGDSLIEGVEVGIEVSKSKVCRPFGKARLRWDFDRKAFDRVFELKKVGMYLGVIEQSGAFYKIPTNDKSIQGEAKLRERIGQDDALVMAIYGAKNKFLEQHGYRSGGL